MAEPLFDLLVWANQSETRGRLEQGQCPGGIRVLELPRTKAQGVMGCRPASHAWSARSRRLMLVLLAFLFLLHAGPQRTWGLPTDVLLEIKAGLGGTQTEIWGINNFPCGAGPANATWPGLGCQTSPSGDSYITSLNLASTGLVGSIPSALFSLHNLTYLDLGQCSLSGTIPSTLGALPSLSFLGLNMNNLTGTVPTNIGLSGSLTWLDFNSNSISGPLPEALTLSTGMEHLHMSYNQLSYMPLSYTKLQQLVHILVDSNEFSQPFPTGFSSAPNLIVMRLDSNQWQVDNITAILPPNLVTFFADSAFVGPVVTPELDKACPLLTAVQFSGNIVNSTVPSTLSKLSHLVSLSMSSAGFYGPLPAFNQALQPALQLLDFQDNNITSVPFSNLGQQGQNFMLQLGGNPVCQNAGGLEVCKNSSRLSLWKNDTVICTSTKCPTAAGPPSYLNSSNSSSFIPDPDVFRPNPVVFSSTLQCSCASPLLAQVKVNSPAFSFFTPQLADDLQLRIFTRLLNQSVGGIQDLGQVVVAAAEQRRGEAIPYYVLVEFWPLDSSNPLDVSAVKREVTAFRLLGPPFGLQYPGPFQDPESLPAAPPASPGVSPWTIVGIVLGGVAALAILLGLIVFLLWRARKKLRDDWTEEDYMALDAIKSTDVKRYNLRAMEDATDGFANMLGKGGYGEVYHGTLPSGEAVAVKRARRAVKQGGEAFRTEIELLSRVRHRNLVALLGYTREKGEQLLVYEFMAQGTLDDWIHGEKHVQPGLSWWQRVRVAEGAARGLAYLHHNIDPPIIHRDIKPANILLTDVLEAKVADFGMSKVVKEGEAAVEVQTEAKGTPGYWDPEYIQFGEYTSKSDVYSFGVALLELATGWRPIKDAVHIRRRVLHGVGAGGIMAVVDPNISTAGPPPTPEVFEAFVRLGMHCSQWKTSRRPEMRFVADALREIRMAMDEGMGAPPSSLDPSQRRRSTSRGSASLSDRLPSFSQELEMQQRPIFEGFEESFEFPKASEEFPPKH